MVERAGNAAGSRAAGMGKGRRKGNGGTYNAVSERIMALEGEAGGGKVRNVHELAAAEGSAPARRRGYKRRGVPGSAPAKAPRRSTSGGLRGRKLMTNSGSGADSDATESTHGRGRKRKAPCSDGEDGGAGDAAEGDREEESEEGEDSASFGDDLPHGDDHTPVYEVEAFRCKRTVKGVAEFFVKWAGWPEKANTWEPYENVKHLLPEFGPIPEEGQIKRGSQSKRKGRLTTVKTPAVKTRKLSSTPTAKISHPGVESRPYLKPTGSSDRGCEGSNKRLPVVTAVKVGATAEGLEEGLGTPSFQTADDGSKDVKGNSLSPPLSNLEEETRHNTLDMETSGGVIDNAGSDLVNGDVHRNDTCTMTDSVKDAEGTSDASLKPEGSTRRVGGGDQSDPAPMDAGHADSLPDIDMETAHQPNLDRCEKAPVGTEEASQARDPCAVEEGILNKESPVISTESREDSPRVDNELSELPHDPFEAYDDGKVEIAYSDGKASSDRVTGAKKRKSGSVKRVVLSSDDVENRKSSLPEPSGSQYEVAELVDGAVVRVAGASAFGSQGAAGEEKKVGSMAHPQNGGRMDSPVPAPVSAGSTVSRPHRIVEIIKAISYNQTVINGKQDVVVIFKALRSDGQEVFVNNKDMRESDPRLLIAFYEQHLRYSNSQ